MNFINKLVKKLHKELGRVNSEPPERRVDRNVSPTEGHNQSNRRKFTVPKPGTHCESDHCVLIEVPPIEVPELSISEIRKETNNFHEKLLRKGSHSEIYSLVLNDRRIVIKKLHKPSNQVSNREFLKQVSDASRLKHENFVELLGYYVKGDIRLLAYEFSPIGSLHDVMHGRRGKEGSNPRIVLRWEQRVRIALESAKGLEYLHEKVTPCITHKDIRSSSILLFRNYEAKIIDYNMLNESHEGEHLLSTFDLGTFSYNAPEYAVSALLTPKSDVFSFGVVILELLTGRKPVDTTVPRDQQSLVRWAKPLLEREANTYNIQQCVDQKLNDRYPIEAAITLGRIASRCLRYEPETRPAISKIVRDLESMVGPN